MATRIGLIADTHVPEARAPCVPPLSTQNVNAPLVIPLGKTFDQPSINFSISRL